MQHRVGVLLHSSMSDKVDLSSRHIRSKSEFDDENDVDIDLNRNELKSGFDRKEIEKKEFFQQLFKNTC